MEDKSLLECNVVEQSRAECDAASAGERPVEAVEAKEASGGRDPMEAPPLTLSGAKQRFLSSCSLKRFFLHTTLDSIADSVFVKIG